MLLLCDIETPLRSSCGGLCARRRRHPAGHQPGGVRGAALRALGLARPRLVGRGATPSALFMGGVEEHQITPTPRAARWSQSQKPPLAGEDALRC